MPERVEKPGQCLTTQQHGDLIHQVIYTKLSSVTDEAIDDMI